MTAAREEFADEVCGFGLLGIVLVNAPCIVTCGDGTATSPASGGRGRRCPARPDAGVTGR